MRLALTRTLAPAVRRRAPNLLRSLADASDKSPIQRSPELEENLREQRASTGWWNRWVQLSYKWLGSSYFHRKAWNGQLLANSPKVENCTVYRDWASSVRIGHVWAKEVNLCQPNSFIAF